MRSIDWKALPRVKGQCRLCGNAIPPKSGRSSTCSRECGERAWIKQDEQSFMMHVAEDEPAWQALTPYVERRPIPEWMGWADRYRKFKLDDLDRKVSERVRSEMDRERAAIIACG